eukprot:CAMPEP_0194371610 /NCGR_PEP_ID=MMETSP0174-20130528/20028_1 /TAXON_ID=216777 /ORGANISM="Proboscia alata, Strain PI-D3" /LENGTH=296 /DNA_ID=CAMNT_0039149777 /DNA_START=29 /DNA_END=920 /DNA_ORIENTATION=+
MPQYKYRTKKRQTNIYPTNNGTNDTNNTIDAGDFFNFDKKKDVEPRAEANEKEANTNAVDEDPIEKIFSFFFGKPEEEPMGMKRFNSQTFPEQYPGTKTEFADPLSSDNPDMARIRPLLKNTNLETRAMKLTYDAKKMGWDPEIFHGAVDKLGGGVVVCTTTDGLVCGGYNPKGWVGYGEARGSIAAFLFVLDSANSGTSGLTKLLKVGGPGLAQMDLPESGPSFSPDALVIPMSRYDPKAARSKLGSYYERFEDGGNSLFGDESKVQLRDLKVYHGIYKEGEYIPFTDAEPFALY